MLCTKLFSMNNKNNINNLNNFKELVCHEVKDLTNFDLVKQSLKSCFSSKQLGYEDFLSDLVGNACSKLPLFLNTTSSLTLINLLNINLLF